MELSAIKGIGPTRLESLRAVGVCSLRDLLYFLPQRYEDRTHPIPCADANGGEVLVMGVVQGAPKLSRFNGLTRVTAYLWDDSGKLPLVWYNQPWMMQNLPVGQTIMLFGRMGQSRGRPVLQNAQRVTEPCILPVYRAVKGIPAKSFREMMQQALEQVDDCCPETLPNDLRIRHQLCELNFAIRQAHFPLNVENLRLARRRLAFEQMLMYQAALGLLRGHKADGTALPIPPDAPDKFWQMLPFPPTGAQKRVVKEIRQDTISGYQMNRLLQGDVGSGKTLVALMSMLLAVDNGFQACMMAPTEILARQHYATFQRMLEGMDVRVAILTGASKARERREALAGIADGSIDLLIGTHALIEDRVQFSNLGFVVIDEQHRFGVEQRARLWTKNEQPPHILVMTATPIPRTLAMTLYGDLDVSVIDELPPGRQPIRTVHYTDAARLRLFGFMRQEIKKGRQIYVVYPLIKESETMDYKDLQDGYEAISRDFPLPEYVTTICHGKMKPEDKEESMRQFKSGEANIMVATSVIEVGVDVPNATVMVIESAERFGLSQLHQLRGRVGRGSQQSYCILMSGEKLSKEARLRLEAMCETNDGFRLAELDLKLRGAGDVNGTLQSGMAFDLKIANPTLDSQILTVTREAAAEVLTADPTLTQNGHEGLRELRKRYSGREEIDFSQIS